MTVSFIARLFAGVCVVAFVGGFALSLLEVPEWVLYAFAIVVLAIAVDRFSTWRTSDWRRSTSATS